MNKEGGLPKPNYTGIPNALFDLMPKLGEAELRVVLAICRQTFGWHKKNDRISLRQLQGLTGMGRTAVVRGIAQGEERGLIKRRAVRKGDPEKGYFYSLAVSEGDHSEDIEGYPKDTTSSIQKIPPVTPEVVSLGYQQKKEKETIQKKKDTASAPRPTSEHQQIIDSYVTELGYRPLNMGREVKAAKWLVDNRYSPDLVIECYRHMKRDKFWSDKFLSLQKVAEQISEFSARHKPAAKLAETRTIGGVIQEKIGGVWYNKRNSPTGAA